MSWKPCKATLTEDRNRPVHYFAIVEFESYEEAMKNSNVARHERNRRDD
jgi:hypothetical protein